MKELIEKRNAVLAEIEAIKAKGTDEKRSYTDDEKTKLADLVNQAKSLANEIKLEQEIEEQRNVELNAGAGITIINKSKDSDNIISRTHSEFVKYLKNQDYSSEFRSSNGGFHVPSEYYEQRATVTYSDGNINQVATKPVSIIEKGLVLPQFGATVEYASGGAFKAPYLQSTPASYGAEDTEIADQAWTAGKFDLVPAHSSASYTVSGSYLKSASAATVQRMLDSLQNRVLQGLEKRALEHIISNAYTKVAATGGTYYNGMLGLEKSVEYANGFIFTKASGERAKQAKLDSGSGRLVLDGNNAIGYTGAVSSLITGNTVLHGDFSMVNMVIWDGIEVNLMQDIESRKKGNFVLIADAFSDAKISNPYAFAVATNVQNWTL